ncbi:MAG: DUF1194 domain-containing protein [Pseudomonadota bacterium]
MFHRAVLAAVIFASSAITALNTETLANSLSRLSAPHVTLTSSLASEPVDMLLCLAADVSESVTEGERDLQKQGHAAAISDPRVVDIIQSGVYGKVAALYVEWADQDQQFIGADWHIIEDQKSADRFASAISTSPAPPWIDWEVRNTSTSEVLRYCLKQFGEAPGRSMRRIIDISSDGTNNVGHQVARIRDQAVGEGVVINVLAIEDSLNPFPDGTHTRPNEGLVGYFKNNVAGGTGSFVHAAKGYASFEEMIRQKFLLELASVHRVRPVQHR